MTETQRNLQAMRLLQQGTLGIGNTIRLVLLFGEGRAVYSERGCHWSASHWSASPSCYTIKNTQTNQTLTRTLTQAQTHTHAHAHTHTQTHTHTHTKRARTQTHKHKHTHTHTHTQTRKKGRKQHVCGREVSAF